jgi:HSP20 family protein
MNSMPEKTTGGLVFTPCVDLLEGKDEFVVHADMPGVDPKELEIDLEGDILTITGKVAPLEMGDLPLIYREFKPGDYELTYRLSENVDREKITAMIKDGVLTLTLPKAEAVKPRKIEIQAA